jgi:hypothetical protein
MKFNFYYFGLTVILFIAEFFIGTYLHDAIIRPYGGDFLIVIFLYCLIKSFVQTPVNSTAFWVLIWAYVTETLQYFHFVDVLGWHDSKLANVILGNFFAWGDIIAYTLGIALVLVVERWRINREISKAYTK